MSKMYDISMGVKDHGKLSGLADDDHPCYVDIPLESDLGDLLIFNGTDWDLLSPGPAGRVIVSDGTDLAYGRIDNTGIVNRSRSIYVQPMQCDNQVPPTYEVSDWSTLGSYSAAQKTHGTFQIPVDYVSNPVLYVLFINPSTGHYKSQTSVSLCQDDESMEQHKRSGSALDINCTTKNRFHKVNTGIDFGDVVTVGDVVAIKTTPNVTSAMTDGRYAGYIFEYMADM